MHQQQQQLKREARALLAQLTEFASATDALASIFSAFEDDPTRAHVLQLLLEWQSLAQSSRALQDVVADFESDIGGDTFGATTDSSADAERDSNAAESSRDWVLLVMGKPALLFATSIYDEDLALLVWRGLVRFQRLHPQRFCLARQALDNSYDSHGFCALHYAIEAQMDDLFASVARDLSDAAVRDSMAASLSLSLPTLCEHIVTQDVVLPMGKHQIQGKNIASGGCTLLHLAAKKGERKLVELLVAPPFEMHAVLERGDFDGNTPLRLALLHGHDDVASFLRSLRPLSSEPVECASSASVTELRNERDARAKRRYIASLDPPPAMRASFTFPKIWSLRECAQVLAVLERITAADGWCTQRHAAYPTTDLPCYRAVPIDAWVRGALVHRLFPQLHERYAIPETKRIVFRELFYVKYEAARGERAELALHCDGSVLSFNVLLNDASEFDGGGTYFEASGETIHIAQGDAVAHSGKVRHAGAPVLAGKRLILVGFLDVIDRVRASSDQNFWN